MFGPDDLFSGGTLHTRRRRLVVGQLNAKGPEFEAAVTTRADADGGFVTEEESTALQAGCSHLVLMPEGFGQCHRCKSWLCIACSQVRCSRCLQITCVSCSRLFDGVLYCKQCWWRRLLGAGLARGWKRLRELDER